MTVQAYFRLSAPGQSGQSRALEIVFTVQQPAEGVSAVTWCPDDRCAAVRAGFVVAIARHASPTWLEAADVVLEEPTTACPDRDGIGERWLAAYPGCVLVVVPTSAGAAELHTRFRRSHQVNPRTYIPYVGWRCAVLGGWWMLSGWPLTTLTGEHLGELKLTSLPDAVTGGSAGGRCGHELDRAWDDPTPDTAPRPPEAGPTPP